MLPITQLNETNKKIIIEKGSGYYIVHDIINVILNISSKPVEKKEPHLCRDCLCDSVLSFCFKLPPN